MDRFTSQIIRNSLFYASEEMGIALRNSAYSPNIKERMDHSTAIFDSKGELIAQAEHIPVHLGSLPLGLKNTLSYFEKENIEIEENSMIIVNNPYIAGTHLNDVTLIRPVFYNNKIVAYSTNKAHHSDVGGKVPGSISIDAKTIYEEGLIIDPVFIMKKNEFQTDIIKIFSSNSRDKYERIGDLKAQVAANLTGEKRILDIIKKYGIESFYQANQDSIDYAEIMFKKKLERIEKGNFCAEDYLENFDGSDIKIKVKISIMENKIIVDYSGTDGQLEIPLNAVIGVTISGVYYVFRTLLGENIPLNEGSFKLIEIYVPEGTILNPRFPAPVAGGNVETSQRNADVLFLAMSKSMPEIVPAASGGSMNNVMIGGNYNKVWSFYETVGVGLGAKKGKDGVDGIQANMTNTMNTPIEEIERKYPILIKRYEFRKDSSGAGEFRGGSGLIRSYEILENNIIFTILSERGRHRPWGLFGGLPGKATEIIVKKGNFVKKMSVKMTVELNKNDFVEIRTAGGGGYGDTEKRNSEKIHYDLENNFISKAYYEKYYNKKSKNF
ncbi:MAG: hydantoinase B/oxoprolinase family protein [Thermoplasmata archaeon]|nr:hydantoinase B/oxoprolinase family protein [Thermoplasmata archaeon]